MLTDIAQILDLGLTAALSVAVVALWLDGQKTRAELIKVLKEIAGLKAQGVKTMNEKYFVVWLDKNGRRAGQAFGAQGFQNWLEDHPQACQYHVQVDDCMYRLATTDHELCGIDHEQVIELCHYLEIPF